MRLLAVRQDNNGDVLLAGPALRALAANACVTLLCGPGGEGAARILPALDDIIVARAEWIEGHPRPLDVEATYGFVNGVSARGFDRAVIFTSFHQSPLPMALLLRLAGVPWIGAIGVDYPGSLLDVRAHVDDDLHEVDRGLALARACGYALPTVDDASLRLTALPRSDAFVGDKPYILVQPGATVAARAWSPDKMRALVGRLRARDVRVVVVGAAAETDLVRHVVADSGALDLAGRTTFAEFAAIVRDARALVVGNTSGIHVASAVGTPVVSIFAPTIPVARFAPWHVPHEILGNQTIACAGCRARTCPVPGQPCTGCVSSDDVLASLVRLASAREATYA
ncbi:MAG: glycosyltransferase family 9 protein [Vulcanimicrobiaceae bacterium]